VNPEGVFRLSLNPGQAMFEALAAHRNFQATTFAADRVAQNTLLSSIQQYFDLLKAMSGINIAEQAVTESKEFLRVTEIREKQGTVLKVEVFRTQAKLQAEKQSLLSAQNEFRQASIRLAITLNLDPKITLFPTDTAVRQLNLVNPSLTLHQLLDIALAKRPEVEESHQRAASATAAKKAAVWNALGPEVALEGAFGGIGKTFGNVDERTSVSGFVGWTLSGSAFGRIKSASARISESQITQEIVQNIIESEVIKAYEETLLTQEQIETAKKGLNAAEKSFELSQTNLKLGTGITLEVLQALEAVTDARTRLVEAVVEYNKAQVRLLNALGELSADTIISTLNL
jgi:outer membrane protein TolC